MFPRIFIKLLIQVIDKMNPSVHIRRILIPQNTIKRIFEIVLHDRTVKGLFQLVPHRLKMRILLSEHRFDLLFRIARCRVGGDIPVRSVHKDQIRLKMIQFRISKHRILPVLSVLGLVKLRLDPLIQKKQLQHPDNVMGCASPQDRNLLMKEIVIFLQKLSPDLLRFFQKILTVKRIL